MQIFDRQVVKSESATIKVSNLTDSGNVIGPSDSKYSDFFNRASLLHIYKKQLPNLPENCELFSFLCYKNWTYLSWKLIVVCMNTCIQIPELDFEIPPEAQRGSLSTVSPLNHLDTNSSFLGVVISLNNLKIVWSTDEN